MLPQLHGPGRHTHQAEVRHLQQAGRQRLPTSLLRAGHMRDLYAQPPSTRRLSRLFCYRMLTLHLAGQSNLPSSCPICEHSPLSADDCLPNKSLRTTIKVFLRTAEKKMETLRAKEAKESAPATPVEPARPQEHDSETPAPQPQAAGSHNGQEDSRQGQDPESAEQVQGAPAQHAPAQVCTRPRQQSQRCNLLTPISPLPSPRRSQPHRPARMGR